MEFSTNKMVNLLRMISSEIDEFFKASSSRKDVRANHIYDFFIRRKEILRREFPRERDYYHFLREAHKEGILKQIIRNHYVNTANYKNFEWFFYRKDSRKSNEIKSESVITPAKYFKSDRNIATDNGDFVRSYQEQYIYNRLLREEGFRFFYERSFGIKGYNKKPDFTIVNLQSEIVFQWEHFGMTDNVSYDNSVMEKIQWYLDKGYRFIEDEGRFIVTYYINEPVFHSDVERIIKRIKNFRKKE